ncbi:MAG: rRNA maturation RNase YbeY [Alphaproteobacteria bacterium]|nr:rRNA maturation RNase YbeY [Alphaproteobacteria bacterium]
MIKPSIHLHDPRWKKALAPYCKTVESICAAVPGKGDVSIVLADDALLRSLNKQYRGKDKPTNVLSFPNDEAPLGDVILAYDTIEREAREQGKKFKSHSAHLIVHGVLHLMGHDHENENDAEKMEKKEVKILAKLGIGNPYE